MHWMVGLETGCDTVSGPPQAEKKRERKRKNLIRPGIHPRDAFRWSRSRPGGWAIAQSPVLNTTITVELLCKRGYVSMLSWYQKVAPHKFTPTLFSIV
jgi:hypothetical protein